MSGPKAADKKDSSADALPGDCLYSVGELVLAYHGNHIYDAKVEKAEIRDKEWRYYVHYDGRNKNRDEWLETDRMLKYTIANMKKQQTLAKKPVTENKLKSGRSAQAKPEVSNEAKVEKKEAKPIEAKVEKKETKPKVAKREKLKNDSGLEKESTSVEKPIKIWIPKALRKRLVDDWKLVNQQDKLVKLPCSPTVDEILTKYLEYKTKEVGTMTDSVAEVLKGLRCYFDRALPLMLLYKQERQQYHDAVKDDVSPSTIYGAEHLLRLFVKLPELLPYVNIEEETSITLQQKLLDFLKFLQRNQSSFFLSVYSSSKGVEGTSKGKAD